jgi:hypothetical protein
MKVTIGQRGLEQAAQRFRDLGKLVRFGAARGLNRTVGRIQAAEDAEMRDVFDRPVDYTLRSVFTKNATSASPVAEVGIKDQASGGRPAIKWLRWQVYGGLRTLTGFEKQLRRAGAMRGDDRMVPGKFARLDAFGNVSRGQLAQILSQLRIETGRLGSSRTLPRFAAEDNAADRKRKAGAIRRSYQRAGGQFVAFPNGRGKLPPGIYLVRQTVFGRASPKPVLIFVTRAVYEAGRFDFFYVAERVAAQHLVSDAQDSIADALTNGFPQSGAKR